MTVSPARSAATIACGFLLLMLACSALAAELLVVSGRSDQILRFDGETGAFRSVFAAVTLPHGIATDGAGKVYVSSHDGVIRQYDESGDLLDFVLTGILGLGCLAVAPDGKVYASVFFEDRVVRVDFSVSPPQNLGNFVPPGTGGLDGPTGLAFGPFDDLFVSSRINGQVLRYDGPTGMFLGVFATPGGNGPQGLTFGPDGHLYVARDDTDTVERFHGTTGAPLGTFADSTGEATDGMTPVFGPDGDLYVSFPFRTDTLERFDGATGAFVEIFIPAGSGGLDLATQFIFVPEPEAAPAGLAALFALAAARAVRSGRNPGAPSAGG